MIRGARRDTHAYAAFGLRIMASGPVPGLTADAAGAVHDIFIALQEAPPGLDGHQAETDAGGLLYRSPDHDEDRRPMLTVERLRGGRLFRFRYADGIAFHIDGGGRTIWTAWPQPWTVNDVATYLLGPVFAFALRLRGRTCLHASAVAIDGRAIAFIGPAGAGKSTVAAVFARRGHSVISDDVLALGDDGEGPVVEPGPCRIRLWPESVAALYGSADALPRLTPTWDKRFLDATSSGYRFQDHGLPLTAMYLLDERGSDPMLPRFEPLSAAAVLMALVRNTQANHLLDARMRAEEFRHLARLAASVRVRRVTPHADVGRLGALCDAIVADVLDSAVHV